MSAFDCIIYIIFFPFVLYEYLRPFVALLILFTEIIPRRFILDLNFIF
jgi:hypothetical protein